MLIGVAVVLPAVVLLLMGVLLYCWMRTTRVAKKAQAEIQIQKEDQEEGAQGGANPPTAATSWITKQESKSGEGW